MEREGGMSRFPGRCPTCGRGETRSLEQNDAMWPILRAIARNVEWHGNQLDEYDWKDIFTAALRKQRAVPNIEGNGFVILGTHTKRLTKQEMADLLDIIGAFAVEHGVDLPEAA